MAPPPVFRKQKAVRRRYTDPTLILRAIERIQKGEISENRAAAIYGIPQATLWDKIHGRRPIVGKCGPKTVLNEEEEEMLENWLVEMSRIGYPLTHVQLRDTVKKILDKDGRKNSFIDNRPGRKWTTLFFKRHPRLTQRVPEHLGKERAIVDFNKIEAWFQNFWQYLEEHEVLQILDDPSRLYNTDESGFPLCVKSGRVIAELGAKDVYRLGNSTRSQITVLACCNADGSYVPPMMVFPGQRFIYNPLLGAPEGSFLGRSHNGWIDSEIFFEWMANHFYPSVKASGVEFPIILFVDGHASHLNIETAKFCRDNKIILYCFPSHCSHILQPLDLSVFGSLKASWKRAVQRYQFDNPGETVQKQTFCRVFNEAWQESATKKNAVSGFRKAGLFPFSIDAIDKNKIAPSKVFRAVDAPVWIIVRIQETAAPVIAAAPVNDRPLVEAPAEADVPAAIPSSAAASPVDDVSTVLATIESLLGEKRLNLFQRRYDNGYDCDDKEYTVWKNLKEKAINQYFKALTHDEPSRDTAEEPAPCSSLAGPSVSSVFIEHLRFPKQVRKLSANEIKSREMPKALSGAQFIAYAQAKADEKVANEEAKQRRKQERDAKKKATQSKGMKINSNICSKCKKKYDDSCLWIGCECGRWFHCFAKCCGIDAVESMSEDEIDALDWTCSFCD
ncbi:uncharacterized protein LOC117108217 [Anneissia japonica]|uniref:uncharacterized protein LOC117108217 n=1 Tax=Anneissia japonica TaxID=1529436 RepID=UPI0014259C03|nr:uncharacterized protein LOC117108217 [Anneissia japonica]